MSEENKTPGNEFLGIVERMKAAAENAQAERFKELESLGASDPMSDEVRALFRVSDEGDLSSGHRGRIGRALVKAPEDWIAYAERQWGDVEAELVKRGKPAYVGEFLRDAGVPRRFRDVLLGEVKDTQAITRVGAWCDEREKKPGVFCLVLGADKGLGKSVAAAWWLSETMHGQQSATCAGGEFTRWQSASALMQMNPYSDGFSALCREPGPLVLDDVGTEITDSKGNFASKLDALIDARSCEYLPLLMTTNLSVGAFKERYSERVVDRIREGGRYFGITGETMRRAAL
jgi:hypothetical protein